MRISGFTIIRNGIKLTYPFLESIQSILPVCDEMIIAVGNSDDGTREAVISLNSSKIKIIDTDWDASLRSGGKILAIQTNIALDAITGDWGFYLQGDEVVHEKDLPGIVANAEKYSGDERVDGLLFRYFHFYGNYDYIAKPKTRGTYPNEVRMIKNNKLIRAFRDAQGFRKFSSYDAMIKGENPQKLLVRKTEAAIYHYGKVRGPKAELERAKDFHTLWHNDEWISKQLGNQEEFDYQPEYPLIHFEGSHPAVMQERIKKLNWNFQYDPSQVKIPIKNRFMNSLEQSTGLRPFSYRNYRVLR